MSKHCLSETAYVGNSTTAIFIYKKKLFMQVCTYVGFIPVAEVITSFCSCIYSSITRI